MLTMVNAGRRGQVPAVDPGSAAVLSTGARLVALALVDHPWGLPTLPTWPLHRSATEAVAQARDTSSDGTFLRALRTWRVTYVSGLGRVCPQILGAVREGQELGVLRGTRAGWWGVNPLWLGELRGFHNDLTHADANLVQTLGRRWAANAAQVRCQAATRDFGAASQNPQHA